MKLNLGCGSHVLDGYINIDLEDRLGVFVSDIMNLSNNFPKESVDEIMMIHVLEHFYYWEAKDLLTQCLAVLKPERDLIIECPDLQQAALHIINQPIKNTRPKSRAMFMLYGDPKHKNAGMCHKWGYTPQSLTDLLFEVGFCQVSRNTAEYHAKEPLDFRLIAYKEES